MKQHYCNEGDKLPKESPNQEEQNGLCELVPLILWTQGQQKLYDHIDENAQGEEDHYEEQMSLVVLVCILGDVCPKVQLLTHSLHVVDQNTQANDERAEEKEVDD